MLAIARKRDPLLVGTEADGVGLFVPASDREFYDPSDVVELEFAGTDDPGGLTLYEHGREKEGIPGRRFSMAP